MGTINDCFSAPSVDEIYRRLDKKNAWARRVAKQLKERCPSSVKITFEAYHRAQKMAFNDILQMDFDLSQQFLAEPDFLEGIRAALIDKDQTPQWQEEVSEDAMKKYFDHKGLNLF